MCTEMSLIHYTEPTKLNYLILLYMILPSLLLCIFVYELILENNVFCFELPNVGPL